MTLADFNRELDRELLGYGPWSPDVAEPERSRQLRLLAGLIASHAGSSHSSIAKLRAAENGTPDALRAAHSAVEALPALTRRRILSTFAAVCWPDQRGLT